MSAPDSVPAAVPPPVDPAEAERWARGYAVNPEKERHREVGAVLAELDHWRNLATDWQQVQDDICAYLGVDDANKPLWGKSVAAVLNALLFSGYEVIPARQGTLAMRADVSSGGESDG